MPALAFYIDAPLQSWGASSKFQYRESNAFPTKSALVGIIAAAMGIDKNSEHEEAELKPLINLIATVVKIQKTGRPVTRITDFHTVGGGYDKKSSLEKMHIPPKASGAAFGTVITKRSYLNDAAFIAILEGEQSLLENVQSALFDPTWGVWFGRKTCLPASPLTPTLADDAQSALDQLLERLPQHAPTPLEQFEYQQETTDGTFYQSDQPVAFGQHHGAVPTAYRARGIHHHRPTNE